MGRDIKILVSFEKEYRAYQGTIAVSIGILRPHAEVEIAEPEALEEEVVRLRPEVVISSRPRTDSSGGVAAWVELSVDPTRPTKICVGGQYAEMVNPTLERLLAVIDELEQLEQTNGDN
jgi:hypothetical protein